MKKVEGKYKVSFIFLVGKYVAILSFLAGKYVARVVRFKVSNFTAGCKVSFGFLVSRCVDKLILFAGGNDR